ncbi:MAG: phosphate ABC transporter permease subunit PstC [Planctomycetales bacterium]|nr:phosphate ABC transporter permease subunit PstC [Planctomycetales bacterium]
MALTATTPPMELTAPRRRWLESVIHAVLLVCAAASVATTVGIVAVLLSQSIPFFREVSLVEFFTGTEWAPLFSPARYGIIPLVFGTTLVAGGAAVIAIPLGLGTAIYLSEYATPPVRHAVKPLLEILAGIPSVVFGYVAVVFISPLLRKVFPSADYFNALNASIVVGVMILPMIISLSEDVLRSVPRSLREGAFALGATKLDVTMGVVVPAALSGIMASFLLAIARAIGETMAVTLAAGATPQMTLNPLKSVQTMTAYIVEVSQGDAAAGTPEHRSIFAVGLTLFVMTLALNVFAQMILKRMREKYE